MTKRNLNILACVGMMILLTGVFAMFVACAGGDDDDTGDDTTTGDDDFTIDDDFTDDDDATDDDVDDDMDDDTDDDIGDDDSGDDAPVDCPFLNAELHGEWAFEGQTDDDPPEVFEGSVTIMQASGTCAFIFYSEDLDLNLEGVVEDYHMTASWHDNQSDDFFELDGTVNEAGTYISGTVEVREEGEDISGTFTMEKQ